MAFVGDGDGSGERFAHQLCYEQAQVKRLEGELAVALSRMRSAEAGCELATGKYAELSLDTEDTIASLRAELGQLRARAST